MQTPHEDIHEQKIEEHIVLAEHPKSSSRFGSVKEKLGIFSKNRVFKLGLALLLISAIPLTVIQSFNQQDIRQQAATAAGAFTLKDGTVITSVTQLEQKLLTNAQTTADGKARKDQFQIGAEDYNLCPNESPGQPGSINTQEAHARALEYTGKADGGGACDDGDGQDLWYFFGSVKDSTGPDVLFTDSPANAEARFAGSCYHRSAHCHDRGCMYYAVDGPDYARVGGWEYKRGADSACFAISTWSCARSGWSKVMGFAQRKINDRYNGVQVPSTKGQLMDRRCALSVAVIEVRENCNRNKNEDCPNAAALGFTAPAGVLSSTTGGSSGGTVSLAVKTASDDKEYCSKIDKSFSDLGNDACLTKAVTSLSTESACTARGYGGGLFAPENPVNRDEFLAFITRYHVYVKKDWQFVDVNSLTDAQLYTDVPKNHPQALNIYTAVSKGFTDTSAKQDFKPSDPWNYGFKGIDKADYTNFSTSITTPTTRGEVIIGLYNYGITNKQLTGEKCTGTTSTTPSLAPGKDPAPFTEGKQPESSTDKATREAVCKPNQTVSPSLLNGFITGVPTASVFNDTIYLFAKGRENKLYLRKIVVNNGIVVDLDKNGWTDLDKQTSEKQITTFIDPNKTFFVTVTGTDGKLWTRSTKTGAEWSTWTNSIPEGYLPGKADQDPTAVIGQYTYSFSKGTGEKVDNNVCLGIIAAPVVLIPGAPGGNSAPATSGEIFASCTERISKENKVDEKAAQQICCNANTTFKQTETVCKQTAASPVPNTPSSGTYIIGGAYYEASPFPNNLTFYAKPIPPTTFTPEPVKADAQVFTFNNIPAGKYRIYPETLSNFIQTFPPATNNLNSSHSYIVTVGPNCDITPQRDRNYDKTQCTGVGDTANSNPSGLIFEFDPTTSDSPISPTIYANLAACTTDLTNKFRQTHEEAPPSFVNDCCTKPDKYTLQDTAGCPAGAQALREANSSTGFFAQIGSAIGAGVKALGDAYHAVNPFD